MIIKIVNLKKDIIFTVKHLFKRLLESPLLIVTVIFSSAGSIILGGYYVFFRTIVNVMLLAMFAVIIKIMTDKSKVKFITKIKYPKLELFSGILLSIFIFIELLVFWKQGNIPYVSSVIHNFQLIVKENVYKIGEIGIPQWIINCIYSISIYFTMIVVPVVILFIFWGYDFKNMGAIFCNFSLILILLLITILLGINNKILFQKPLYIIMIVYVASIFSNALAEELFYRGFLLPRLETVLKNPINALIISAIIFNISHVPSYLAQGINVYKAILFCLSMSYPTGLIFGYLYLKTRSIVPGIMLHASNTILGIVFISVTYF